MPDIYMYYLYADHELKCIQLVVDTVVRQYQLGHDNQSNNIKSDKKNKVIEFQID